MSVVVRYAPQTNTTEQYDQVLRRLEESGNWPADRLDYHVALGPSGDFRISEIWDSREQWEAFTERLLPLLNEAGIDVSAEPDVYEVYNTVKR